MSGIDFCVISFLVMTRYLHFNRKCYHKNASFDLNEVHKKYKCEMRNDCVAYTFDKSRMTCVLHASIDKGTTKKRRKQTGVKKADYTLSLPEMTFCFNENQQKRCKREPKCRHANCNRNAAKLKF